MNLYISCFMLLFDVFIRITHLNLKKTRVTRKIFLLTKKTVLVSIVKSLNQKKEKNLQSNFLIWQKIFLPTKKPLLQYGICIL